MRLRSLAWPAAAVCGCMLLAALVTVLLKENDPSLLRLSVNQQTEALGTPVARSIGQGFAASAQAGASAAGDDGGLGSPGAATAPTASGRAGTPQPGAAGSAGDADGSATDAGLPGLGASQAPYTLPGPAPGPRPRPRPTGTAAVRPAVTGLTLALIGGDRRSPATALLVTVSADGPGPVRLDYSYGGVGGSSAVSKSVVLSGRTQYTVIDAVPSRPYCGTGLTAHADTFPAAGNGTVTATTTPRCAAA